MIGVQTLFGRKLTSEYASLEAEVTHCSSMHIHLQLMEAAVDEPEVVDSQEDAPSPGAEPFAHVEHAQSGEGTGGGVGGDAADGAEQATDGTNAKPGRFSAFVPALGRMAMSAHRASAPYLTYAAMASQEAARYALVCRTPASSQSDVRTCGEARARRPWPCLYAPNRAM